MFEHERDLRKGRRSIEGQAYAINKKVKDNLPLLIPDPHHPLEAPERAEPLIESMKWLHQHNRIACQAYTIMPDHFHFIFTLLGRWTLEKVMHSLASFTGLELNKLCGRTGPFWQHTYYDRAIRDDEELQNQLHYILINPVKAGYVDCPEDWPFTIVHPNW